MLKPWKSSEAEGAQEARLQRRLSGADQEGPAALLGFRSQVGKAGLGSHVKKISLPKGA